MKSWLFAAGVAAVAVPLGCADDDAAPVRSTDTRVSIVIESANVDLGATVTTAHLTVATVEIEPCPGARRPRGPKSIFGIRSAHAHTPTTPTRLGIPAIANLARGDGPLVAGAIAPPEIAFCTVRVGFGPADGDTKGMPGTKTMVGRTLFVEGDGLRLTTTATRTVDIAVPAFVPGSSGHTTAIHVSWKATPALAGVDTNPLHIAEASALVLDRLVAATAAHIE